MRSSHHLEDDMRPELPKELYGSEEGERQLITSGIRSDDISRYSADLQAYLAQLRNTAQSYQEATPVFQSSVAQRVTDQSRSTSDPANPSTPFTSHNILKSGPQRRSSGTERVKSKSLLLP